MKYMIFTDGSNFLAQLAKHCGGGIQVEKPSSSCLRIACEILHTLVTDFVPGSYIAVRRYWFSSYVGDEQYHAKLCEVLRERHFEPVLFRRRSGKEKGVDIALTQEMLVNAFNQNYDLGILVAGDDDYVGLVQELKRYGPVIWGSFVKVGLSDRLRLAFDYFKLIDEKTSASISDRLDDFRKAMSEGPCPKGGASNC